MTMVEALQESISQFLQRWLGLLLSLSIDLYGQSTNLHFLFSGLVEEFKVTQSREVMMCRNPCKDRKGVAGAGGCQ